MDEFVSKKLLVAKFNELASKYIDGDKRQRGLAYTTAADMIALADAADVQPVKHGRWIKCDYKRLDDAGEVQTYIGQGVYCSKCRTGFHKNEVKNWIGCPCCLTRMDGDSE